MMASCGPSTMAPISYRDSINVGRSLPISGTAIICDLVVAWVRRTVDMLIGQSEAAWKQPPVFYNNGVK